MNGCSAARRFWRDAAQFQREGAGYCSTADGQVAACAFASFVFDDPLEIGIETHPDHQHQGHALTAAIALIDHCLRSGLTPVVVLPKTEHRLMAARAETWLCAEYRPALLAAAGGWPGRCSRKY